MGGMLVLADSLGRRKCGGLQQIGAGEMVESMLLGQIISSKCLFLIPQVGIMLV